MHQTERVMEFIINSILPKLTNTNMDISYLQGPIETLYRKEFIFIISVKLFLFRCHRSTSIEDYPIC